MSFWKVVNTLIPLFYLEPISFLLLSDWLNVTGEIVAVREFLRWTVDDCSPVITDWYSLCHPALAWSSRQSNCRSHCNWNTAVQHLSNYLTSDTTRVFSYRHIQLKWPGFKLSLNVFKSVSAPPEDLQLNFLTFGDSCNYCAAVISIRDFFPS